MVEGLVGGDSFGVVASFMPAGGVAPVLTGHLGGLMGASELACRAHP
jgi:hypothetical protein